MFFHIFSCHCSVQFRYSKYLYHIYLWHKFYKGSDSGYGASVSSFARMFVSFFWFACCTQKSVTWLNIYCLDDLEDAQFSFLITHYWFNLTCNASEGNITFCAAWLAEIVVSYLTTKVACVPWVWSCLISHAMFLQRSCCICRMTPSIAITSTVFLPLPSKFFVALQIWLVYIVCEITISCL